MEPFPTSDAEREFLPVVNTPMTKQDADEFNLRTVLAYTALLVFLILLAISPAVVIGAWKALV